MRRREFIRNLGFIAAGLSVSDNMFAENADPATPEAEGNEQSGNLNSSFPPKTLEADVNRTISVVIIGIGNRGNVYARYALKFPQILKVAGLVDVDAERLERAGSARL